MSTNSIECPIFAERCLSDPQGVIRDLVAQTVRQGKTIYELNQEIARLRARTGPSLLANDVEVEESHDCPF